MPSAISLNTPIEDLHGFKIARLGPNLSRKLAAALASYVNKKHSSEATVEDLLTYLPMRYEDRSHLASIRDLTGGKEATLELTVKHAGGYQVRNKRTQGKTRLFIFEVAGVDINRTGRDVVVWWFVSGRHAYDIIKYYQKKLERGARFITFGRWDWDSKRGTYSLRLNRPADELEMLASPEPNDEPEPGTEDTAEDLSDPTLAAIHVGRRVPVYRKLGDFNSKRLREIVHAVLAQTDDKALEETLPSDLRQRAALMGCAQALREIHFPPRRIDG